MDQSVIAGRYELVSPLGRGGMGQVWKAYDTLLDRSVAIKLMRDDGFAARPDRADDLARRFRREASVTAGLRHTGVPAVHDAGAFEGSLYLVMELVEGHTLGRLIAEHGPLPVPWAAAIAARVCEVLDAAHRQSLIHRDLKPQNIMLAFDGAVKVLDFGVAAVLDASRITRTGESVGTPAYMSPEQLRAEDPTARTDLYALGCVIHEMLTGRPVFEGSHHAMAYQHMEKPPPRLRWSDPTIPADLEELVLHLLAKDPRRRPSGAAEVYRRLVPHITSAPPLAGIRLPFEPRLGPAPAVTTLPEVTAPAPPRPAGPGGPAGPAAPGGPGARPGAPRPSGLTGPGYTPPRPPGRPAAPGPYAGGPYPPSGVQRTGHVTPPRGPGGRPVPPGAGPTPPGAGITPPGAGVTPPGAGVTPPGAGVTPPGAGSVPPGAGSVPPGPGVTPPTPAVPYGVPPTGPPYGAAPTPPPAYGSGPLGPGTAYGRPYPGGNPTAGLPAGWKLAHSLWMLPVLLLGMFTWVSFLYIGARARRRAWLVWGGVYLVLAVTGFAAVANTPEDHWLSDAAVGFVLATWVGGVIHAMIVNPERLRLRAMEEPSPPRR
ncbi:serine/threonine-protein kinase [Bailinhaonella thermotolerans]|uniref:serine/threonine-protein kinase n=1 Tax=Bailinhaonella thermotolerans TaxID=1070861 RepID=UPI0011C39492|nr:serine/threonine-protein kinase [Bailinhaonella thermotolerans]